MEGDETCPKLSAIIAKRWGIMLVIVPTRTTITTTITILATVTTTATILGITVTQGTATEVNPMLMGSECNKHQKKDNLRPGSSMEQSTNGVESASFGRKVLPQVLISQVNTKQRSAQATKEVASWHLHHQVGSK